MPVDVEARMPAALLARQVAERSRAAPFSAPADPPGRRAVHLTSGTPAPEALPSTELAAAHADTAGLPRLHELKAVFDPHGILNPGKGY